MFQAILKFPLGTENVDETEAGTADGIVSGSILLGVSDKQAAAYVLDIKGREASGNTVAVEGAAIELYAVKTGVINLDGGISEIRDIKESIPTDFAGSHSLVDRTVRRAVMRVVYLQNGIGGRRAAAREKVYKGIPAGDGAVFSGKDEDGGFSRWRASIEEEVSRAAIEHDAGGS
jgi:hypothetical protein